MSVFPTRSFLLRQIFLHNLQFLRDHYYSLSSKQLFPDCHLPDILYVQIISEVANRIGRKESEVSFSVQNIIRIL